MSGDSSSDADPDFKPRKKIQSDSEESIEDFSLDKDGVEIVKKNDEPEGGSQKRKKIVDSGDEESDLSDTGATSKSVCKANLDHL